MSLKVLLSQPILFVPESTTPTTHSGVSVPVAPRLSPNSEKRCVSALSSLLSTFPGSGSPAIALSGLQGASASVSRNSAIALSSPLGATSPSAVKKTSSLSSPSVPSISTFLSEPSGGRKGMYEMKSSVPMKRDYSAIELSGSLGGSPVVKRRKLSSDTEVTIRVNTAPKVRARGLRNSSGVHCYRNASLQALGHIPGFRSTIRNHKCTRARCPACALKVAFQDHFFEKGTMVPPHEPPALRAIAQSVGHGFERGNRQEDAHEYIGLLLDRLAERSDPASFVKQGIAQTFGASKVSEVQCVTCKKVTTSSSNDELVVMLTLPQVRRGEETSLEDCLREHTKEESVNDYRCEACGRRGIKKRVRFAAPPRVALMALTRFNWRGRKDNRTVSFKEKLNWRDFTTRGVVWVESTGSSYLPPIDESIVRALLCHCQRGRRQVAQV
ncbi:hypothetical protein TWF281_005571 [Arthrobotrys megalospora]